ncbi:helix-turn-helix transcriptional regulator [Mycobacterium noviomagense]|uniref:Transcriptional regulator n=1 Tax=Mycobacterium noviomagense TaxID=459858 RepID=A0A7I7PBZ9_9MYCO|nr:LuxR family transcriptional regulator [Mycobacterium noviomagense]ORB12175.1 LuxR family transcriptional regulator [Mycobacterium noviomagense]BBY06127.1 transcriptional regulator [Mycobacterium noviomagense]
MSQIDPRADIPLVDWSELGVSALLPTGTVTLLLADVEGSTRLWETQPEEMTAAFTRLDHALSDLLTSFGGARPVEQGEGDSFVVAFARASDAVACALELQRAPLAPIRLRIGVHTGEVQLRDEGNYIGPTINRTARLRDLAHGGQTVLSGTTEDLVVDALPADAWLTGLGTHELRGVARPERVVQLCHPDLRNEFPPLRVAKATVSQHLPAQLTNFIGRQTESIRLRQIIADNRLVTLTGAGGAGKTRLAVQVTAGLVGEFPDGVWFIDLAPVTNPVAVPLTVARTLGLPDQPGRSTMEILLSFVGDRKMLLLLDNCEHLLDACGQMIGELFDACPQLTILTTSREPLGLPGELTWRVPSLSVDEEAIELFTDRARRIRPDFRVSDDNVGLVTEICRRLDGMPLAIELAAARTRALSLTQIVDSLHDRFRLLTGGARTAVRRQQTLRASVDWSHALLTEPERVLFRRLAAFMGGFDLDAAQTVGASSDVEGYQILDQLSLLVDKSLVVAEEAGGGMRYRLLETVRQYGLEKLSESGEAVDVRTRHRDYYTQAAAALESQVQAGDERLVQWADVEIDNLRAAFAWSRENSDVETALRLVSSLYPFWERRGRVREGLAGFDAVLTDERHPEVAPAVWVRAVADNSFLAASTGVAASLDQAREALAIARELDDPGLITRALMACGMLGAYTAEVATPYFAEAIDLARAAGDRWTLCGILLWMAGTAGIAGEPTAARAAAEEGRDLADALGDRFLSGNCRAWLGFAMAAQGNLADASRVLRSSAEDAQAAGHLITAVLGYVSQGLVLAYQGHAVAAYAAAQSALAVSDAIGGVYRDAVYAVFAQAALAGGDTAAARQACEVAWRHTVPQREVFIRGANPLAEAALACGDLAAARRWADDTVAVVPGWYQMVALTARAYVAIAQGEPEQAERDAHEALAIAARTHGYLRLPDTVECLARLAADGANHHNAARLFGAADAIRQRTGQAHFPMYQAGYDAAVAAVRDALGQQDFDVAWAEGAALSMEEAIAYAQRGRGERRRSTSGWGSLTPTERDVVRLVGEGLPNKDIATRLFVSPRTVQSHLTHVYSKLGLTSRVQLVQEAARH